MSYESRVNAITNLTAFWQMDDTAGGTTVDDATSNALDLTLSSAKVDGLTLYNGGDPSTRGNGTSTRATRAVTAGTPLQLTGSVTIGAWIKPATIPANSPIFAGRNANWQLRYNSGGTLGFVLWLSGATFDLRAPFAFVADQIYFVVGVWDAVTQTQRLYVDGVCVRSKDRPGGSIITSTDSMDLLAGSSSGPWLNGDLSGVFVAGTAVQANDLRLMYLEGSTLTPPTESLQIDYQYNDNPVVADAADGTGCALCGGKRKANEPAITKGSVVYHPGCYGLRRLHKAPVALDSSSTQEQFVNEALRIAYDTMAIYGRRVNSKSNYFDGDEWQPTSTVTTREIPAAYVSTVGTLRHMTGLPDGHWLVKAAIATLDKVWTQQDANGLLQDFDFSGGAMGVAMLLFRDIIPVATFQSWLRKLVWAGKNYLTRPVGQPEVNYYVNGNRELFELITYWALWQLTGESMWEDVYETQYTWTVAPVGGFNSSGFGLVTVVAPTEDDWSDGKGYLGEKGNTGAPGYDPGYTHLQLDVLCRLYALTGELRYLRLANITHNQLMDRVNTSTWVLDGSGGTRTTSNAAYNTPAPEALTWRGGRTDITTTTVASHFNAAIANIFGNQTNFSAISYRGVNLNLAGFAMASDLWVPPWQ